MLATAWPPFHNTAASVPSYLPARPSPLSPRSANACPRPQFWGPRRAMSHSVSRSNTPGSENENDTPFSKRDVKPNPVIRKARQTPDEARERRREMFMKKVEQGREEKQWKGRSEQILRSDYLAQRRRWEEERDREARFFFDHDDYEQVDEVSNAQHASTQWPMTPRLVPQPDDEQQVDEIAQMEEDELRALLELQEQEAAAASSAMQEDDIPSSPTRYGSDEEDYDEIFMELVSSQQQAYQPQPSSQGAQEDADMMDMV